MRRLRVGYEGSEEIDDQPARLTSSGKGLLARLERAREAGYGGKEVLKSSGRLAGCVFVCVLAERALLAGRLMLLARC